MLDDKYNENVCISDARSFLKVPRISFLQELSDLSCLDSRDDYLDDRVTF